MGPFTVQGLRRFPLKSLTADTSMFWHVKTIVAKYQCCTTILNWITTQDDPNLMASMRRHPPCHQSVVSGLFVQTLHWGINNFHPSPMMPTNLQASKSIFLKRANVEHQKIRTVMKSLKKLESFAMGWLPNPSRWPMKQTKKSTVRDGKAPMSGFASFSNGAKCPRDRSLVGEGGPSPWKLSKPWQHKKLELRQPPYIYIDTNIDMIYLHISCTHIYILYSIS